MSEQLQPHEFIEQLKLLPDFTVIEVLQPDIYSLIVMYKDNSTLCSRATYRKPECAKYINKRLTYIADLQEVLRKRNIKI